MSKIQALEDENCALKQQKNDSVMDEAMPDKEDDKYIYLSSGEKLMRPPPPGSKSSSQAAGGPGGLPFALPSILKTGWKPKAVAFIVAFRMNLIDKVQALIAKYLGDKHFHTYNAVVCFFIHIIIVTHV